MCVTAKLQTSQSKNVGRSELRNISYKVIFEEYTLTRPMQVLKSKVNLGNGQVGANQVLSTEIEGASKVQQLPLNVNLRQ